MDPRTLLWLELVLLRLLLSPEKTPCAVKKLSTAFYLPETSSFLPESSENNFKNHKQ